jgi:hypothetical protein
MQTPDVMLNHLNNKTFFIEKMYLKPFAWCKTAGKFRSNRAPYHVKKYLHFIYQVNIHRSNKVLFSRFMCPKHIYVEFYSLQFSLTRMHVVLEKLWPLVLSTEYELNFIKNISFKTSFEYELDDISFMAYIYIFS